MAKQRRSAAARPPTVIRTIPELSDDAIVMRDALLEAFRDPVRLHVGRS